MLRQDLPWREPAELARKLHRQPGFVWLDSADAAFHQGRYSYIAINPVSRFQWGCRDSAADFAGAFRAWRNRFQTDVISGGAPFQGGVIGYVSYEAARIWMRDFHSRHASSCDVFLEFSAYDTVLAFDHQGQSLSVYSAGLSGRGCQPDPLLARQNITQLVASISENDAPYGICEGEEADWSISPQQADYTESVSATRDAILDGEIYQANIATLWTRPSRSAEHAFNDYLGLRDKTQAGFSAFGAFSNRTIACLSPERLVAMTSEGAVRAEPIKGTARRSSDPDEDQKAADALSASDKDRAENIMIVDLLRNDLSRVCQPESVHVSRLCRVEPLPNLFHLVSTIEGKLSSDKDVVDLLGAVFPGGSITGAPKLRAMEIIDQLEPAARGAFCGAFGYIGHDGACDFNIMIRTIDHMPEGDRYWSGAGITLLSDAAAEWDEVRLKAERILGAARAGVSEA
ncbi:MAG: anthranilate synthase component I family protein [Hyphomonas sp.]|nr:anthranilate synthase component I family protein [Hyphomonas sp.]